MRGADLKYARLRGADMRDTDLPESTFIILDEKYFILICRDYICVGYKWHSVSEWRQFSQQDIEKMYNINFLKFYPRLLDIIDFYCGRGDRPKWLKK